MRKLSKWSVFTVIFAALPILFDSGVLAFKGQPLTMQALSADASIYLLGFGIIASGLGDAVFEKRLGGGFFPGSFIAVLVLSIIMLVLGPALYALAKAFPDEATDLYWLAITYSSSAVGVSLSTVWIAAR